MRRLPLRRPTPALVIACIALFISLGGVSWGFASGTIDSREIRNNSVLGRDIKDSTITTKDLRNNEVRGADIRNSTITGRDVALDTLGGFDIKESTLGQVPDSARLQGRSASEFVLKQAPAFTALTVTGGTPGTPAPAIALDGNGYVHLQGTALAPGNGTVFTLPGHASGGRGPVRGLQLRKRERDLEPLGRLLGRGHADNAATGDVPSTACPSPRRLRGRNARAELRGVYGGWVGRLGKSGSLPSADTEGAILASTPPGDWQDSSDKHPLPSRSQRLTRSAAARGAA